MLVPLHGLGSDQVDKATVLDQGVEAYYIDEHKAMNAKLLTNRLKAYSSDEKDCTSIILFASPNALRSGSRWLPVLEQLARDDIISMLAVDEAHEVHQSGRNFSASHIQAFCFFTECTHLKYASSILRRLLHSFDGKSSESSHKKQYWVNDSLILTSICITLSSLRHSKNPAPQYSENRANR
jgi:hypothetical protein